MSKVRFDIGTESFPELIENGAYYVDKTKYLKDLFLGYENAKAPIFIRPRRFGKTLNMSMIKSFCEINYQNPGDKSYQEKLFLDNGRNLAIAQDEFEEVRKKFMAEFPVVSLSFKGIAGHNFQKSMEQFSALIASIYDTFLFLAESTRQTLSDRRLFLNVYEFCNEFLLKKNNEQNFERIASIAALFLQKLCFMLFKEYGRKILVILDEYDVPLQKSIIAKEPYYDRMLEIIRQISVHTFKQNPDQWLFKGIVTGCLKIAHQSIFTDANNFVTYSIEESAFSGFFGFTDTEIKKILIDCDLVSREKDLRDWYDGYRLGADRLYCPWSVTSFCSSCINSSVNHEAQSYWINTSGNDIIQIYLMKIINNDLMSEIEKIDDLLKNKSIKIILQEFATYPSIKDDGLYFDTFMTLLLHTGYLTFDDKSNFHGEVFVRIPNMEVRKAFEVKLSEIYSKRNPLWVYKAKMLAEHLLANEIEESCLLLNKILGEFISVLNCGNEFFYHGFIQGLLTLVVDSDLEMNSEEESGDGYSDITLYKKSKATAVILEFKTGKNNDNARMLASEKALLQIIKKDYAKKFIKKNCLHVYGIGIGFGGKECEIKTLGDILSINDISF